MKILNTALLDNVLC